MEISTIVKNCRRLLNFYCDNNKHISDEYLAKTDPTILGLLNEYSQILDVSAAPKEGLSLLFLPEDDYLEAKEYVATHFETYKDPNKLHQEAEEEIKKIFPEADVLFEEKIAFSHLGYYWLIKLEKL